VLPVVNLCFAFALGVSCGAIIVIIFVKSKIIVPDSIVEVQYPRRAVPKLTFDGAGGRGSTSSSGPPGRL
jgi:hypothetical protein